MSQMPSKTEMGKMAQEFGIAIEEVREYSEMVQAAEEMEKEGRPTQADLQFVVGPEHDFRDLDVHALEKQIPELTRTTEEMGKAGGLSPSTLKHAIDI